MNRYISRGALGLVCASAAGACGGSAASVPLPGDAVWCDVHAFGCADFDFFTGPRISVGCGEPTSIPVLVSPPVVGSRVCVGHNSTTAAAACASVCTTLTADKPHIKFAYPKAAEGCVATINSDSSHAYDSGQFVRSSCTLPSGSTNQQLVERSDPTTHAVRIVGSGGVSYAGSLQDVGIVSGYLNLAAPNTSCLANQLSCAVHVNQIEIKFADFSVSGKFFEGLTLYSRESPLTGSGQFEPSVNRFIFNLPRGIQFDAVAKVDGAQSGFAVLSESAEFVSVDLATGEVSFQYSLVGSFAGNELRAVGVATTIEVLGRAPVITAPEAVSVDATTSCTVTLPLQATVASPLGLPTFSQYFVDGMLVDDSSSVTVDLPVGYHSAKIVAWDSLGEPASAMQSITVNDATQLACQAQ